MVWKGKNCDRNLLFGARLPFSKLPRRYFKELLGICKINDYDESIEIRYGCLLQTWSRT